MRRVLSSNADTNVVDGRGGNRIVYAIVVFRSDDSFTALTSMEVEAGGGR
jgi:hypothetical protein